MKNLLFVFLLVSQVCLAQSPDNAKPTTLILIRHAERGNDGSNDPPLAEEGTKRAVRLAETLKNTNITAIFSTNYKRTKSTIAPLAQAKGLEVKVYEPMKEEELKKIVNENKGGTVVICGHSNTTPWSANFLTGEKLENFADTDYGNILIVTFWDFGKTSMTRINY
jgi:broad specificity phosphatase PhoE